MTVAELIAELQKAPQDAPVVMLDADTSWYFIDPEVIFDNGEPVLLCSKEDYGGHRLHDWDAVLEYFKK